MKDSRKPAPGRLGAMVGLVLTAAAGAASADVVHMKNGDRLSGVVDSIARNHLVLDTDYAGTVVLDMDAVLTVETEEMLDLRFDDGTERSGRLVAGPEGQAVAEGEQALQHLSLDDLRTAGQNKLSMGSFGSDWSSRLDLSAVVSNGNSDTEAYNALAESTLKRNKSEHSGSILLSKEKAEEETTKDQFRAGYGYKRFFSEKWFGSGNAEYFEDSLRGVDYRVTAGGGVGYRFWDTSFGALTVEAGANVVVEKLDGERDENPALRWALEYNRFLFSKKLEFFHNHSLLVISSRGEVLDTSTGLRLPLNDWFDANLRVDYQRDTDPPEGNGQSDVTYNLGVGVKF